MDKQSIKFFDSGISLPYSHISDFMTSWLYKYFVDLYGDLQIVSDPEVCFLAYNSDGTVVDEIYCKDPRAKDKALTFIPKSFLGNKKESDDPMWKELRDNGFYISSREIHPIVKAKTLAIPFESNPNLPESIKDVDYEKIHYQVMDAAKFSNKPRLERRVLSTDALEYSYNPEDKSIKGPYSFHMDYTPGVYYMYFNYITEANPVKGRELIIGERDLFTLEEGREGILRSGNVFKEVKIPIKDEMIIFMNTYNPKFVHKVMPLLEDQKVVTLTTYVYT